tara:strand:+ start:2441 stop:8938 length:6498 start_codon:yes stop_codon:yes gene_type:complete
MGINDLYGSLRVWGQGDNNAYTGFSVVHSGTGIADFIVRSGGDIGMGTSTPDWDLELFREGSHSEAAITSDGGNAVLNFQTRDETDSYIVHRKGNPGIGNAIWAAGVDYANGTGSYNTYVIATGTTFQQDHQFVITSGGTFGVRKLAPEATFDIAGDLMVRDVLVGGNYNLIWDSTTNSVKRSGNIIPVNLTGTTFLVSGYTTGCTTFLVYSAGTGLETYSANTCEDFGPYRYGKAPQSIEPKLGANQSNANYSVIGGGRHNIIMSGKSTEDNVIAAGNSNIIESGFTSSGIFAGKQNKIVAGTLDSHNVIAGGILNTISGESYSSILGSTSSKLIGTGAKGSFYSSIVGGSNQFLHGSSYAAIVGGIQSVMSGSLQSIILGGTSNESKYSTASFIGGGGVNTITGSVRSGIVAGSQNTISGSSYSIIAGGVLNGVNNSQGTSIVGGESNRISENSNASIVGGSGNTIESTAISSAIIGASELNAISAQTTYLRGLNVNSDVAGNTPNGNWLRYHGINAEQGLNRVLVSIDNDGHAKWKNLANIIPSGVTNYSGSSSDVYVLTAYTSGCTWYGVTNSGTTLTADTCSSSGPYMFGFGINSIKPIIGANQTTGVHGAVINGGTNNNYQDYTTVLGGIANIALGGGVGAFNLQQGVSNFQQGGNYNRQYGSANIKSGGLQGNYATQVGIGNMIFGGILSGYYSRQEGSSNLEISSSGNTVFGVSNLIYNANWNNVWGHNNVLRSGSTLSTAGGSKNLIEANFASILNSSGSTVLAAGGHILGGTGHTIYDTANSSAILGGNAITARTSQTTYTHGLNAWTDTIDGDRPFHYHGGAANNIIIPNSPSYSGSPNVFLAGVNADGRARWEPIPGSVKPQFMSGDTYVVSAHTIGCTLYLYTNSGNTVTADTCNNFASPYKWVGATNSWNPTVPGGPNDNRVESNWSQILGGGDMFSGASTSPTPDIFHNKITPQSQDGNAIYIGNQIGNGTGNHIFSGQVTSILNGGFNIIMGQPGFGGAVGQSNGALNTIVNGAYCGISGWTANFIGNGQENIIWTGATSFTSILNGRQNQIFNQGGGKIANYNYIGNGQDNTIQSMTPTANQIINGNTNRIVTLTTGVGDGEPEPTTTTNAYNTIVNGLQNSIVLTANSVYNQQTNNTILNGSLNSAGTLSQFSTILGGKQNWVNGSESVVLGGSNHHNNANKSAVLAGYNHHISPNAVNSSILAGQDIFAYSADTSYTNLLNVQSAMTSTTITQILVRELDPKEPGGFGAIKVRDYSSFKTTTGPQPDDPDPIGISGGLITGDTEFAGVLSACTLVTANITACSTGDDSESPNIILASPVQANNSLTVGTYGSLFSPGAAVSIEASGSLPALSAASNNDVVAKLLGRGTGTAALVIQNESYTNTDNTSYLYSKAAIRLTSEAFSFGHTSYTPFGIFTGSSANQMLAVSGTGVMIGRKAVTNAWTSNQDFSSTLTIHNTNSAKDVLSIYGRSGILLGKVKDGDNNYEVAFGVDPIGKYNATFTVDTNSEGTTNGRVALFNQNYLSGTKLELGQSLNTTELSGRTYVIQSGNTSIFGQHNGVDGRSTDFSSLHQSTIAVKAGNRLPYNIVNAESSGSTHLGIGTMHPTKPLTVIGQISGTSEMYLDGALWSPRIYGYCNSGNTYNKNITQLTAVTINDVVQIGGGKNNNSFPELLVRGSGNSPEVEIRADEDAAGTMSGYVALSLTHYSGITNTQPKHEWRVIHAGNDRNQFQIKYATNNVDVFEAETINKGVYAGSGQSQGVSLIYVSTGGTLATGGGFLLGSYDRWSDRGGMLIKGWSDTSNYDALHIVNSGDTSLLRMRNSGDLGIGVKYPDTRLSVSGEVNTQVVSVTGDTTLDGALSVSGLTSFVGESRFSENVTINGGLTITASTYPGTPLFKADDNIVVIWPAKVGIGPVPLTISGTTNISGNTSIDGLLTLNSGLKAGGEDGKLDVVGGIVATYFTGDTVSATSVHADTYITLGGKSTVKTESDGGTTFGDSEVKSEIKGIDVKLTSSISNVELSAPTGRGVTISSGFITGGTAYSANTAGRGSITVPSPSSTFSSGSTVMGLARKYITQDLGVGPGDIIYVTHNLNTKDIIVTAIGYTETDGTNTVLGDASVTINIMNYNTIKVTGVVEISMLKIVIMTI